MRHFENAVHCRRRRQRIDTAAHASVRRDAGLTMPSDNIVSDTPVTVRTRHAT